MKNILLLSIILLLTACLETEHFSLANSNMDFQATSIGDYTKAQVVSTFADGDSFALSSYYGSMNELAHSSNHYFSTKVVNQGGKWTHLSGEEWPNEGKLTFHAHYPNTNGEYNLPIVENNNNHYSNHSITYDYPVDVDEQLDILASTVEVSNRKVVRINFNHILSKISFKVNFKDEVKVRLDYIDVKYTNFESKKTYNFKNNEWSSEAQKVVLNGEVSRIPNSSFSTKEDGGGTVVEAYNDVLMVLPQAISSSEYLSVSLGYTYLSEDNIAGASDNTEYVKLPVTNNEYKQGEGYSYIITVDGEEIEVSTLESNITPIGGIDDVYGNIDFDLINTTTSPSVFGYTGLDSTRYTTALRIKDLLSDEVRNFKVVGTYSYDKLPGWGRRPFQLAAESVGMTADEKYYVDFSGVDWTWADTWDEGRVLPSGLFQNDERLTKVKFSSNITGLGGNVFENAKYLSYINLDGITKIEKYALARCEALSLDGALYDLSNIVSMGEGAFCGSLNLELIANNTINLQSIPPIAFENCKKIGSIVLPNVNTVNNHSFLGCDNLIINNLSNLEVVGDHAFQDCVLLNPANLNSLTHVYEYGFNRCAALSTAINAPNLILLEKYAFYQSAISSIVASNPGLNYIGTNAFAQNCSLKTVDISGVTDMDDNVFLGSPNIEILRLPSIESLDSINTFLTSDDAHNLKELILSSVNDGLEGWGLFMNHPNLVKCDLSSLEVLDRNNLFAGCANLKEVYLTNLTEITSNGCGLIHTAVNLKRLDLRSLVTLPADVGFGKALFWSETSGQNMNDCVLRLSQAEFQKLNGSKVWAGVTWGDIIGPTQEFPALPTE